MAVLAKDDYRPSEGFVNTLPKVVGFLRVLPQGKLTAVGLVREIMMKYVIDQTRGRVFHQDIQTPRSVLKNEAVGRVF